MTVKLGGLIATEYHDQTDIKVSDFVDGRFTLGLWLDPGFRVDLVQILSLIHISEPTRPY